ncbi:glutathione binding-like protein [uncultured Ruegeria sp.]|uniref:glutathione S-transferase family protein n=1 Tax=uncultured Ruegeria sp. TaxID=259304 RepID=UPI00263102A3|nr:glutathione binding-like protein [uncultured Ruegeria sp.]
MQLFIKPHASSLAPHIVLNWLNLDYDLHTAEFFDDVLYEHNATGTVGFMKMDDGTVLTQVGALMKHLVRSNPSSELGPSTDHQTAYQTDRWLLYLASDVHPPFHLLFLPDRYAIADNEKAREAALALCYRNFEILNAHLEGRAFMLGDKKSIVDALLFPMIRWSYMQFDDDHKDYTNLNAFHDRMEQDLGVRAAMEKEGIWQTISR